MFNSESRIWNSFIAHGRAMRIEPCVFQCQEVQHASARAVCACPCSLPPRWCLVRKPPREIIKLLIMFPLLRQFHTQQIGRSNNYAMSTIDAFTNSTVEGCRTAGATSPMAQRIGWFLQDTKVSGPKSHQFKLSFTEFKLTWLPHL